MLHGPTRWSALIGSEKRSLRFDRRAAHTAEFVSTAIVVSAHGAVPDSRPRTSLPTQILFQISSGILGVGLCGQTLRGFERGCDGIRAAPGSAHGRRQTAKQF